MGWGALRAIVAVVCCLMPVADMAAYATAELPIKLYRKYVIVARGSIGNLHNLNFVIDTGAVPSILDCRVAQSLHLKGIGERLSVFTQDLETQRVMAPDVSLGPFHSDVLPALVGTLSFVEKDLGIRVDAVVGLDLLNQTFTIDYRSGKITVGPIDPSLSRIPYDGDAGYAVVEMKIRHQSLRLLVDTGASDLMLFEGGTRDYADAIRRLGVRSGSNMGGEIRLQLVELTDAYLGSMAWGSRRAFIMPEGGRTRVDGLSGLLGIASLKASRFGFDVEHRIFAFETQEVPVVQIGPTVALDRAQGSTLLTSAVFTIDQAEQSVFGIA